MECEQAARLALKLQEILGGAGLRVVGVQLRPDDGGCAARLVVVVEPGEILFVSLGPGTPVHPAVSPGLERSASPRLHAAAIYMLSPEPEETVLEEMSRLVGGKEAERVAAFVWRLCMGEGYTLDEWAGLLDRLRILSPWECVLRFQVLVERGVRSRPRAEPLELDPAEVLRHCCKVLGTG